LGSRGSPWETTGSARADPSQRSNPDRIQITGNLPFLAGSEPAGSPAALYETRVADIACVTGAAPCLDASETAGFVVDEAEVTFWGLCPDCQSRHPEKGPR
jgi:hypothetical protein